MVAEVFIDFEDFFTVAALCVFEVGDGGLGDDAAGFEFLAVGSDYAGESKKTDERRQGESLQNQRDEDDEEGEAENHVAMRGGRPVGQHGRKSESSGERDDAAHAGPADDKDLARLRHLRALMETGANPLRQVRAGEDPGKAQEDEYGAEDESVANDRGEGEGVDGGADGGKLQADEDEDKSVEDEGEGFPDGPRSDTHGGREEMGAAAGKEQSATDDGEDSGGVDGLRGEIGGIRDEDADGDFDRAVVDAALEVVDDPSDDEADHDASGGEPNKSKHASGHGGDAVVNEDADGELESEETGGVVDEAFAFEDVDDAFGQSDAAGDGSGGDGGSGGDDSSEDKTETPVKAGKDMGRGQGDSDDGEGDQPEGEQGDGDDVVAEVAP